MSTSSSIDLKSSNLKVCLSTHRYPFCIVWTPIPVISWLFPIIGHLGIATSQGVIRDFAGSYFVSEDSMAFGWPTAYWQLSLENVLGGSDAYDKAIDIASNKYKSHTHNLFCDNCHSHVALALNTMRYANKSNWNMVNLCFYMFVNAKFIGLRGLLQQYLPFLILVAVFLLFIVFMPNFKI